MIRRVAALAALGALALGSTVHADVDHYVQVERGRYLAVAGDCSACHASQKGAFAGGRAIETPFGNINAANLTPDRDTGIGRWSAQDFWQALHTGTSVTDGRLYPAFPYNYYTKVTREDSDALFAYLRSLDPVVNPVDRNTLPWPFSMRISMLGWNTLEFSPSDFKPDPNRSPEFNRGAYLVEGLGHCGACHTPMDLIGGPKTSAYLQGNVIQNWLAPSLTNDTQTGLGSWSVDEVVEYLKTGRNVHAAASGPMGEVVTISTSKLTEPDLRAIATYLKQRGDAGPKPPAKLAADDSRMTAGQAVYVDSCSACHTRNGTGIERMFPRLADAPSVRQDDPTTLIRVILTGTKSASTELAPTGPAMPSFGWNLSDAQIAAVLTYIRNTWQNAASPVSESQVASVRKAVAIPGK